jgi:hypothetical protein
MSWKQCNCGQNWGRYGNEHALWCNVFTIRRLA